jgi:predicted NBD/HSP70 family sugar kinase
VTSKQKRSNSGVASSETAREINRNIILHAIHAHQPVSRADLARYTGLQASTVSVIVGQLIDEGWVLTGELGRLPRGRRPTYVMLNDKHATLAIDLRPSEANLAVVDINGKILGRETVVFSAESNPRTMPKAALADVIRGALKLKASFHDRTFNGVGVSVSGRVDQKTHRLIFSPNAPWNQIDLYNELRKKLHGPIVMENAANASLFAERWFGEFGRIANIVAVSVSDGLGTGLLLDGRLVCGSGDMAGEFGHIALCGVRPPLRLRQFRVLGNLRVKSRRASLLSGTRTREQAYFIPAPAGPCGGWSIRALRSIDKMAGCLARGLSMLVAGLAPEVIIIVGDFTALWPRIWPILGSRLIARSFTPWIPRVVAAVDGDTARNRGAAALLLHTALFGTGNFETAEQ